VTIGNAKDNGVRNLLLKVRVGAGVFFCLKDGHFNCETD